MSLRAAGIEAFGDNVALLELPEPPPLETGQVLIEVKAAGVGNWEEFVRTGGWDVGRVPPLALGLEAAGEVVGVAANSGARVIATASESSAARVMALGATVVVDYHDPDWTSRARDAARSSGIRAAANAAGGGEGDALSTLVDGGRLATITGAPPPEERGISIANVIIRPDGEQLRLLAASLAEGKLHIDIRASYPLTRAAEGLAQATTGSGGAVVLEP